MNGAVIPPRIGREDAYIEGLRVLVCQHVEHVRRMTEIGGPGAGYEPIRIRCLIGRAYLDLVASDHLKKRVRGVSDGELLTALRREAGIPDEAPRLSNFSPEVKEAGDGCSQVKAESSFESDGTGSLEDDFSVNTVDDGDVERN